MQYKNDPLKALEWLKSKGALQHWNPTAEQLEKVNQVANACMAVYDAQPGDLTCIGWFPFSEVYNHDGSPAPEHYRHADGFCYTIGDDREAVIGIRTSVLKQNFIYAAVGVGLHETAHLRYEEHSDDFVSLLLELQYNFMQQAEAAKSAKE